MHRYRAASLAVALTIAFTGAAFAQAMPTNNPAAAANVRQSEQYSAALRTNPAFRKRREAVECGPITDPQLRQNCINSFEASASGSAKRGQ
jgi:hypothetical protein